MWPPRLTIGVVTASPDAASSTEKIAGVKPRLPLRVTTAASTEPMSVGAGLVVGWFLRALRTERVNVPMTASSLLLTKSAPPTPPRRWKE